MHLVIEPGLRVSQLLARSVALSRADVFPRVARSRRALQADRDRRRLGAAPAGADDAGRSCCFAGWSASSAASVPDAVAGACRGAAVAVLRQRAVTESSASLIGNTNLISKVYFPRLIVPIAAVVTALVDFVITLVLLAVVMAWYRVRARRWTLVGVAAVRAAGRRVVAGLGLFLAALNVEYRDFRYVVPFIIQVGLFVSPIAFSSANVPERWRAGSIR